MTSITANALSGLRANQTKLLVASENIANAQSSNYDAKQVELRANGAGGVEAEIVEKTPSRLAVLNAEGQQQELPNVSLEEEIVNAELATYNFKANATVIRSEQALGKRLIDILA